MSSIVFAGTAVTRPGSIGTLFRAKGGEAFTPVQGIPLDTGVQAVTTHPLHPGIIFASTHAGLFKSEDAGVSFTKLAVPSQPGEHFWSCALHPNDPDIMLAGCGPISIYKSENGGQSWRRVGGQEPMTECIDMSEGGFFKHSRIMSLAFDPTDPLMVYGAVETSGFIASSDAGESWHHRSEGLMAMVDHDPALRSQINVPNDYEGILDGHTVRVSKAKPGVVFYACRMGLFSTADGGATWHDHELGNFAPFNYTRDLRIAANDPKILYVALSIASRSNAGALYRSDDIGKTWARADEQVSASTTIMSMGASATDSNKVIYVTRGGQVHWSDDGCETWSARQLPAEAGDAYCSVII